MSIFALLAAVPIAASPLQPGAFVPFAPQSPEVQSQLQGLGSGSVEVFDPIARAQVLAAEISRTWQGTYRAFGGSSPLAVKLVFSSLTPVGQVVVLRGTMTLGSLSVPVQGNLNAKSDQLDLLTLGDTSSVGAEPGGQFQGLQGLELSGWTAPRLTTPGGRLELKPAGMR